jgi:glycine betaine/proline transport system substrate-binding protein
MKPKKLVRTFILHALAVATAWAISLAAAQAPERPGEGVRVQPGVASWTSALPVSWAFVELLSELGYDVQEPTLFPSNPVAYLSVAQGDIDYWPNGWFPLHNPQLPDDWEAQATIFEPHCPACGIQGYLVDIASLERFDITSLDDFRREEVKEAFDATGDGRADLFGCPPGWGCHEGIEAALDAFDLRGDINHLTAEYAANFADVLARIRAGEPTLYYTWAPSAWILALVPGEDVLWINAPGILESEDEVVAGLESAVTDPVQMGFIAADIAVAANNAFLEANPAAAELFRQVRLPLVWISEVDARIAEEEIGDAEVRELAREWIEENRELVEAWLEAARQAAQ